MNPDLLRPTVLDIDLDRLAENLKMIQAMCAPARVMPILKANAYGHGLVACARVLEKAGAFSFGVAFLEEAIELRKAGIKIPVLALGGISGRQIEGFLRHDVDITASSVMKLELIEEKARQMQTRARVHLKIDTGMERIGVHWYSAEALLRKSLECRYVDVVGIFSHFATAESEDNTFSKLQLERFLECAAFFDKNSVGPKPLRHIANSAAILRFPESHLDVVRPGLILYGASPAPELAAGVKTGRVMTLRSEVVYFKVVKESAGVSYDLTWQAREQTRVVTVPAGYGDGYPRALSNKGAVLIRGKRCPIVGRICMDQLMLDIGPSGEAYNGDEVILLGRQGDEEITVEEIAALAGTDPRDVFLSLNLRVPRRFHKGGDVELG